MNRHRITLKRVNVTASQDGRQFTYQTYRVSGTVNGRRVRQQFSSKDEAQAALTRLQVAALRAAAEPQLRAAFGGGGAAAPRAYTKGASNKRGAGSACDSRWPWPL